MKFVSLCLVNLLAIAGVANVAEPLRIAILGDSTVADIPYAADENMRGWGTFIEGHFKPGTVKVFNFAKGGRSSKTFIAEGLWEKTLTAKPDIVLIQFGHNDSHAKRRPEATDAATDFRDNLLRYVNEATASGSSPILVTPMHRRTFNTNGTLEDNLKPYADAMKQVAVEKKVPVIDLHTSSGALLLKLGEKKANEEYSNKPGSDATHFNEKGARAMAELVMKELPALEPRVALARIAGLASDKHLDADSFEVLMDPFVTGGSSAIRQQAAAVLAGTKLNREQLLKLAASLPAVGPVELPQLLAAFRHAPADAEIAAKLLEYLEAAPARWSLTGAALQAIFRRFPAPASENAASLIAALEKRAAAKELRITKLEKYAGGGNADRGRAAFFTKAGACVSCHRVGDIGGKAGPDLTHIGSIRKTRELLGAIAFPGSNLARGYESFGIQTRDGRSLVGTIPRVTNNELIVVNNDGKVLPVLRSDIAEIAPVKVPLMPAGLDRTLDQETLADLVAFLKSLK